MTTLSDAREIITTTLSHESQPPEEPSMPKLELTLIVAATTKMGIGRAGGLPWTGLRKEMNYFARVTKRAVGEGKNTVIMGRKTWESIPPKFRPLKDRHNIVISRSVQPSSTPNLSSDGPTHVASLSDAMNLLTEEKGGRTFIIGGAQIYAAALERPETKRILLTRVQGEIDCDTYFPTTLVEGEENVDGWVRKGAQELGGWTGEDRETGGGGKGIAEVVEEGGVRYGFEMWERS